VNRSARIAIIAGATLAFALAAQAARAESTGEDAAGLGTYSQGYRMGRIVKCSVKGLAFKSTECALNMGKDGDVWVKVSGSGDNRVRTQMNPWAFSGSERAASVLSKYEGKYVVIKYDEAQMKSPSRDTAYTVMDVSDVTRKTPSCKAVGKKDGSYSEGSRFGRVVKISEKGTIAKTYELTMQVGESGKDFIEMSINDPAVFNCALEWLQSGKPVNVRYTQKVINLSLNDTSYVVYGIEGSDDL